MANTEFSTRLRKASEIGLVGWPDEFEWEDTKWKKDHETVAKDGEVQCVEYCAQGADSQKWLVVTNE